MLFMTRSEVERLAKQQFTDDTERWKIWMNCGVHNCRSLPLTTDSGEHYCPNCCTIWSPDGAIQNIPRKNPTL
jgi:hypothetical protein